jgi:hypothetical protein
MDADGFDQLCTPSNPTINIADDIPLPGRPVAELRGPCRLVELCPLWVRTGNPQSEHSESALPPKDGVIGRQLVDS